MVIFVIPFGNNLSKPAGKSGNTSPYDLSIGFKPEHIDRYLRKEYSKFLRDTIRFAILFNPSSERLDKLIEILTSQKITTLDSCKLFKTYIIGDPDAIYDSFMESTKKFVVSEENSEDNLKKLKREMKKHTESSRIVIGGIDDENDIKK